VNDTEEILLCIIVGIGVFALFKNGREKLRELWPQVLWVVMYLSGLALVGMLILLIIQIGCRIFGLKLNLI
jgi:hypothetical protein